MDKDSGVLNDAEDSNSPKLNRKQKAISSDSDGESTHSQKPKNKNKEKTPKNWLSDSDDESEAEISKSVTPVDKQTESKSNLSQKLKSDQYESTLFEMPMCTVSLIDVNRKSKKKRNATKLAMQGSDEDSDFDSIPLKKLSKNEFVVKKQKTKGLRSDSDDEPLAASSSKPILPDNESKDKNDKEKHGLKQQKRDDGKLKKEPCVSKSRPSKDEVSDSSDDDKNDKDLNTKPNLNYHSGSDHESIKKKSPILKVRKTSLKRLSSRSKVYDGDSDSESDREPSGKLSKAQRGSSGTESPKKKSSISKGVSPSFNSSPNKQKVSDSDTEDKVAKELPERLSLRSLQSDSDDEPLKKKSPISKSLTSVKKATIKQSESSSEDDEDSSVKPRSGIPSVHKFVSKYVMSDSSSVDESDKEVSKSKTHQSDSDEPLKTKSPISKSRTSFKRSPTIPTVSGSDSDHKNGKERSRRQSLKSQKSSDGDQHTKKSPVSKSRRTSIKKYPSKTELSDSSSEDKEPKSKSQGQDTDRILTKPPVPKSRRTALKKRVGKRSDSDSEYATESDSDVCMEPNPKKTLQSNSKNESAVKKSAFSKSLIHKLKKYSSETNSDSDDESNKRPGTGAEATNVSSSKNVPKKHQRSCSESSIDAEVKSNDLSDTSKSSRNTNDQDSASHKEAVSRDTMKKQTKKTELPLTSDSEDEPLSNIKMARISEGSGDENTSDTEKRTSGVQLSSPRNIKKKSQTASRSDIIQNSDTSDDDISLNKLKLKNRKRKAEDSASDHDVANENGAKRKRAGCSDGTSDSCLDDGETLSADNSRTAAQKKEAPTKKPTGRMNSKSSKISAGERKVIKLKGYIKAVGLRIMYVQVLKKCKTTKAQVNKLLEVLEDAGMKGSPTLKKCERLKHKREKKKELEALDQSNILGTPQGRSRRTRQVPQSTDAKLHVDIVPGKKIFSRLKGIVDSDDSSN